MLESASTSKKEILFFPHCQFQEQPKALGHTVRKAVAATMELTSSWGDRQVLKLCKQQHGGGRLTNRIREDSLEEVPLKTAKPQKQAGKNKSSIRAQQHVVYKNGIKEAKGEEGDKDKDINPDHVTPVLFQLRRLYFIWK